MQGPGEVVIVDDGAAAGIDDHGSVLHPLEDFFVEYMGSLGRQDHVDGDNIAAGDQFLKGYKLHIRVLCPYGITDVRITTDNLCSEPVVEDVVQVTTCQAKSIQAQRQLPYVRRKQILTFRPVSLSHFPVIVTGVSNQSHNHGGSHICQFFGTETRQIQNDYPAISCRGQINAVDASTKALYKAELRQSIQDLAGNGGISGCQNDLCTLAACDNLRFCGFLLLGGIYPVIQQAYLDSGSLIGCCYPL